MHRFKRAKHTALRCAQYARRMRAVSDDVQAGVCQYVGAEMDRIVYCNKLYRNMLGLSIEQSKLTPAPSSLLEPRDAQRIQQERAQYLREGKYVFDQEMRMKLADGAYHWMLHRCKYNARSNLTTAVVFDISRRQREREKLKLSEQELLLALQQSNLFIARYDVRTQTLYQRGGRSSVLLGVPDVLDNVPESLLTLEVTPAVFADTLRDFYTAIRRGDREGKAILQMRRADTRQYAWFQCAFVTLYDDDGAPLCGVITGEDITERREKELAYEHMQQEYAGVPETQLAMLECNLTRDTIDRVSGKMLPSVSNARELGFDAFISYWITQVPQSDLGRVETILNRAYLIWRYEGSFRRELVEFRCNTAQGALRWMRCDVRLARYADTGDIKVYLILRDVDAQKRVEQETKKRLESDALTGALNRTSLWEKANAAIKRHPNSIFALLMLDMDDFKGVNDSCGHSEGDRLLRELVTRLRSVMREQDLLGRVGGDEFILCMTDVPSEQPVLARAQKICKLLHFDSESGATSVSVGVAMYPRDGKTVDELYRKADEALYRAKHEGKGCFARCDEQHCKL